MYISLAFTLCKYSLRSEGRCGLGSAFAALSDPPRHLLPSRPHVEMLIARLPNQQKHLLRRNPLRLYLLLLLLAILIIPCQPAIIRLLLLLLYYCLLMLLLCGCEVRAATNASTLAAATTIACPRGAPEAASSTTRTASSSSTRDAATSSITAAAAATASSSAPQPAAMRTYLAADPCTALPRKQFIRSLLLPRTRSSRPTKPVL